jgi:predicted transcriptional regulator of viral defense system
MEKAQLLYRTSQGRYVVAPRGSFSATQAAPVDMAVARLLEPAGPYYIGYLSGLISHRLTDVHSADVYAGIPQSSTFRKGEADLPGGRLHVVRMSASRWPQAGELDEQRVLQGSMEFVWRSGLERTLIDALHRPDLSGGIETVMEAWNRALRAETDWEKLCQIAGRHGRSTVRRVALVLRLLGLSSVARRHFPDLTGRGTRLLFDRSDGFGLDPAEMTRDRETGVVVNVPADHLQAWLGATVHW